MLCCQGLIYFGDQDVVGHFLVYFSDDDFCEDDIVCVKNSKVSL